MGDFNGHIGFIGLQPVNSNGNRVLNWMITFNLILLNGDINCTGEITWSSRGLASAIDFNFVNNVMYEKFINKVIDEDEEKFDLSDHNLLSAYFNISMKTSFYSNKKKEVSYFKFTEENENKFLVELENRVRSMGKEENGNLVVYEKYIKELADKHIKRKVVRYVDSRTDSKTEPMWITSDIKKGISKRRYF